MIFLVTLNEAVKSMRAELGISQQEFATRLGLSIRAIVNYEKDRTPEGPMLARLHQFAAKNGFKEQAYLFWDAMTKELGETGINKIAEVWNLAVQARRNWVAELPGTSREKVPDLIEKIIEICVEIHPTLAWSHEEMRKFQKKQAKKK